MTEREEGLWKSVLHKKELLARNLAKKKAITLLDVWDYYEALEKEKKTR